MLRPLVKLGQQVSGDGILSRVGIARAPARWAMRWSLSLEKPEPLVHDDPTLLFCPTMKGSFWFDLGRTTKRDFSLFLVGANESWFQFCVWFHYVSFPFPASQTTDCIPHPPTFAPRYRGAKFSVRGNSGRDTRYAIIRFFLVTLSGCTNKHCEGK